jgi:ABC-type nitrate/sulfonate/bicarbonate transport system permease component
MWLKRWGLALALPATLVLAWEGGVRAGWLDPLFFPSPSSLAATAAGMCLSGELPRHLLATLRRLLLAFGAGSSCGLLCGLLMGSVGWLRRALEPTISAMYSTPKLTMLPLLMLLFGIGEGARIFLIATSCFIFTAMHGSDGARSIQRRHVEVARNYGARGAALVRKVYLPSSLPQIFTGLRLALGRGLVLTISVELIGCPAGLGSVVWMAWQTFATERLYVAVICSALVGTLFHAALRRLEAAAIPWREDS